MSVGEIVEAVDIAQPTVSHHLRVLAEVGFVTVERRATSRLYRVNENCLAMFPSAAEVVMGRLPRVEVPEECRAPWQCGEPAADLALDAETTETAETIGTTTGRAT
jgi:DNA-binding transcriptional ArsR family regulator